ncbi:hypothetical protein C806_02169 [Lachnospiraceae bacterium 3-1]|nr:hypothetical protein C806_02169 [Lachnospiraceae bacterium 3-1]
MGNSVITVIARKKMALARKGEIRLPCIAGIALGDGGEVDGEIRTPLPENITLFNEIIRKPYAVCNKISEISYRYRIDLAREELAGKTINEMALYDEEGDLLAIRTFVGKPKEDDMEMGFEFDDIF